MHNNQLNQTHAVAQSHYATKESPQRGLFNKALYS